MAESSGGSVKVGELYYDVIIETAKMVEGQRQSEKVLAQTTAAATQQGKAAEKLETSLTQVAQATKVQVAATQLAASANREAAKAAADTAAANTKVSESSKKAATDLGKQGISAKQTAAAMRGVPAQFTDIATSLAGGQNPLTVLLQQGGQLKDMFGGAGAAARALGTYVLGLINPVTIVAAAAAALGIAFTLGRKEGEEFSRSIALTGNTSGVTAQQLQSLAAQMDKLSGVTRGQAAEALNIFVQAGVGGAAGIGKVTEAALRLEQAGGPAVADTAKQFKALEKDPLQASLKLNESVNFLTDSLYKQIKSLEQQGKLTDAARVAQNAYADALLARTPQVIENIGYIERAWRAVKNVAREGWDAVLGVGREATQEEKVESTRKKIAALQQQLQNGGFGSTGGGAATGRAMGQKERAEKEAMLETLQEQLRLLDRAKTSTEQVAAAEGDRVDQVRALAEFDKEGEKFLTDRVKMEREIALARQLGLDAGLKSEEIEKRVAQIRQTYKNRAFDASGYVAGLQKATQEGVDLVNQIEVEALRKNQELLNAGKISREQAAQASKLIEAKAAQERLDIQLKGAENVRQAIEDGGKLDLETRQKAIEYAAKLTSAANPIDALRQEYEAKLQLVTQYEQLMARAGVDVTEQSLIARTEMERAYQLERQKLAEQTFRAQSDSNAFLLDSLTALSTTATSSIMGLLNGTMSAADAMRALGATVLNEAVGALVQIGVQQIKNALTAQTIAAADKARAVANGAVYAASVAAQVTGMSALAAQNAFAATAAIPIIGPALAPAAAGAAAAAASALGAPAIATAPIAGARRFGGNVNDGNMYRINEAGQPEMFTASNGDQYMLPTANGNVTPAGQVGGGAAPTVIIQNMGAPLQVQSQSFDQQSNQLTLVVGEVASQINERRGPVWGALQTTNVQGRIS